MIRNCVLCGKEFVVESSNQRLCSEECRKDQERIRHKEAKEMRARKKKKKVDEISLIQKEAQALGLSYGQYVARMGN